MSAVVVLASATIGYWWLIWPASSDSGLLNAIALELAYWQLVGSVLAVLLAVLFGRAAIDQLALARQVRDDDRQTEQRRVLRALYDELRHNWMVSLDHEGRLVKPDDYRKTTARFQRTTYDALKLGPLWAAPIDRVTLASIQTAYDSVDSLVLAFEPRTPLLAGFIGAVVATAFNRPTSVRDFVSPAFLSGVVTVSQVVWNHIIARQTGKIAATREAVEAALDAMHTALPTDLPNVAYLLNTPPLGFEILPMAPRSPIVALLRQQAAAIRRWLLSAGVPNAAH